MCFSESSDATKQHQDVHLPMEGNGYRHKQNNELKVNPKDWKYELHDNEAQQTPPAEASTPTEQLPSSQLARVGLLSGSNSAMGRWLRSGKMSSNSAAKRARDAARLKALQRTPYPMVLARIKLLLDRLQLFKAPLTSPSKTPRMAFTPSTSRLPSMSPIRTSGGGQLTSAVSMKRNQSIASGRGPSLTWAEDVQDTEHTMLDPGTPINYGLTLEDPSGSGSRLSLDKIMEELAVTFSYVSEFLRKVPEETRLMSILWVKMENFKKDQTVYTIGDEPEKFYIILTGSVEVWTHPPGQPRDKTIITTLKKGQSFGDHAILNRESRGDCVTPSSNCTFLTVDCHSFMDIFGSYFNEKLQQAQQFFEEHVDMFKKVPRDEGNRVVRQMLLTHYPAGREWDPINEQQIYFIKEGSCTLESLDRKFIIKELPRMLADTMDTPTMSDHGVLANVMIKDGRAVGTLGHEEELRRLRRSMIPKKTIAKLGVGSHFGGGVRVMGDGDLQTSLKVMAETDLEVYHMHVDQFFKNASPGLVSALRDDVSFKLTYYYGRIGTIGHDTVVGHSESLLSSTVKKNDDLLGVGAHHGSRRYHMGRRKRNVKQAHEPGHYSAEVEKALSYMHELQTQFDDAVDMDKKMLMFTKGTPAERFWATPAVSSTSRSIAIAPLLAQVYPEGLAPLVDKIDELVERTMPPTQWPSPDGQSLAIWGSGFGGLGPEGSAYPEQELQLDNSPGVVDMATPHSYPCGDIESTTPNSPAVSPSRLHSPSMHRPMSSPVVRYSGLQRPLTPGELDRLLWPPPLGPGLAASPCGSPTGKPPSGVGLGLGLSSFPQQQAANAAAVYSSPQAARRAHPGALTAASILWERTQETNQILPLRQCLMYEEIVHIKAAAGKRDASPTRQVGANGGLSSIAAGSWGGSIYTPR